jgi:uncharacterized protein YukE
MADFGAIDARFRAVDDKFVTTNQDIGKLESRVDKLENTAGEHAIDLNGHKGSIDRMADDMKSINKTVENILANMNKGIGAVKIINIFFGVIITFVVAWIGLK